MRRSAEAAVKRVISKYKDKTSSESGLMTTAHFVGKKMAGRDLPAIVQGVQKIMGNKYSEEVITEAILALGPPLQRENEGK